MRPNGGAAGSARCADWGSDPTPDPDRAPGRAMPVATAVSFSPPKKAYATKVEVPKRLAPMSGRRLMVEGHLPRASPHRW
jgi:hypothetical protein